MMEHPERLRTPTVLRIALSRNGRGWRLAAAASGLMVHQVCEAAVPVLIGVIIDRAVATGDLMQLLFWLGALAVVFVVLSLSYQWASLGMVGVYSFGEHDLRQLTLTRVLHPLRQVGRRREGELLSIATSDTYRVAGVSWSIAEQAATIAAVLVSACVLFVVSVPLGLGVLIGAVLVLSAMQLLVRPIQRRGLAEQASVARASDVATDTMQGLRIVHGLGAQDEVLRRYRLASSASRTDATAASRMLLSYQALSAAVSVLYLAGLALAAAWMASAGHITAGQLVTVVGLAQFLQGSLAHLGTFAPNWAHKRASSRRLVGLLTEPFELPPGSPASGGGVAEAEEPFLVWRPAAGSALTITGRSGLVGVRVGSAAEARAISARLAYRTTPAREEILLVGEDAVDLGPDRYAARVVAPPHNAMVFTGSLRDNVAADRVLDVRIVAATALDDVIEQLGSPEAPVGEGGRRLSGGQRQRLLLARALHADGDVVVLDEPTTALDPVTEQQVAAGLHLLQRPIVVITSSRILLDACRHVIDAPTLPAAGRSTTGVPA
ncbi:ABC transporter transmembrane domain-containing protein [Okibacterium endophyticum]